MKRLNAVILSMPLLALATALGATLKGRIVDPTGDALPGASYKIISLADSSVVRHDIAGDDATFMAGNIEPGQYAMIVEMAGMDPARFNFSVADSTKTLDMGDIMLDDKATMLAETVVIGVKSPVVAKQDTLEYNAGSFRTRQNATVEDLLKKLPGVEVGSDGSVSSGGKSVTKILVNGKEFFSDDPTLATKNLTADMVEKVQVIDRKSDVARLTGVDDGEDETVINLTVKKSMNQGWFGTIAAGYGTSGHYEANASVNYFNNGNQISLIAGGNNLNDLGFGDRGRGNFRDFGASNGITTSRRAGVNFNVGNDTRFRIGGNIFYSYSDRRSRSKSDTQYLFPDSTSYQTSGQEARDRGHNVRADLRMQWKIDEYNTIDFRPRFSWNSRDSRLNDSTKLNAGDAAHSLVNATENARRNSGNSISASGDLIYNHNFRTRPGRSFSVRLNYQYSNTRQNTLSWSDIAYFLQQDEEESLYRFMESRQWSNTIDGRLTWTEPLGNPARGNYLQIAYRINYRWNNSERLTYNLPFDPLLPPLPLPDMDSRPDDATFDSDLSNSFRNSFYTHEVQVGYKKTSARYNLEAGLIFSPSGSQSHDLINSMRDIPLRTSYNFSPFARLRYKFSKTRSLSANYRARTSQPSLTALQPVADVSDPLNITIGNPQLKPTFTQSISAHYNNYNTDTQSSTFAALNASMALNNVTQKTTTDPSTGARTTTYTNTNGAWNVMGMGMFNTPLRNKSWRINARLMANFTSTPGFINGDYNRAYNLNISPTAGVTYSIDLLQLTLNPAYSFQLAASSLAEQNNRYVHSGGFDASAVLSLPFGLEISTDYSFRRSSGYAAGFNRNENLWNAQISYSMLRDRSLTFSVRAYDLLGQNRNISRSISADRITDSEYNDLTRYVMFGVSWTFNTMRKKNTARMPDDYHDGPGMHGNEGPQGPPPTRSGEGRHMGPPPGRF